MDDSVSSAAGRPELSTAQLAERVQVPAGTLRMWEERYGFPAPHRLPSGHRRYSERDADQIREVLRLRDAGTSLPAAILAMRSRAVSRPVSIFARVRSRCPDLQTVVLEQAALFELTRAIEDEYLARGSHGVVIGSFQRAQRFHSAQARWQVLADLADLAVALADFPTQRQGRSGLWEVPVAWKHPLRREWALLVHSPAVCGALAAWELPRAAAGSPAERWFEVLICTEPAVVHAATSAVAGLVYELAPMVPAGRNQLGRPPAESTQDLRASSALTQRSVGYLLGAGRPGRRASTSQP